MRQVVKVTTPNELNNGGKFASCGLVANSGLRWRLLEKRWTSASHPSSQTWVASLCVALLLIALVGCQTTSRTFRPADVASVLPNGIKSGTNLLMKPQASTLASSTVGSKTSGTSKSRTAVPTKTVNLLGEQAVVRGQSGDGNRYAPPVPAPVTQDPNSSNPGLSGYGYNSQETLPSPSDYGSSEYGSSIAPGATQSDGLGGVISAPNFDPTLGDDASIIPGVIGPSQTGYQPQRRVAPLDVFVQEARTGRIILGGSVNSDLGVAGQLVIDERNFNIRRLPRSWKDLWSGRAFRGGGQNFRLELMPGNRVERYTVSWTERNLFGYLPYSLSIGGFYYTRQFRDWTEQRLGGRVALGYEVTKDLAVSTELRMEDVTIFDPRFTGVSPELDDALGSSDLYTGRVRIAHDTRDSPFMASQGSLLELVYDHVFGEYDYSRGAINYSKYFRLHERPDGTGRHVLASTWRIGVSGAQTPIFENYFAGGYSTLRGFSFRGASPKVGDIQVGGELQMLGSLEYVFPLTADEMLRGVAFVDYGTVEQDLELDFDNFRVAPGLGLRIAVPALGPAPLAFDFAYALNHADSDDRQVFSFFMGFTR